MNIKDSIIIGLLVLLVLITTFGTYQISKVNKLLSEAEISPQANIVAPQPQQPAVKKPSDYKIGIDYNAALKENKPILLLFYADWCGFCIRFMPIYEKLYGQYKNKYNFVKINVEDEKYSKVVEKYAIEGFPTVFLVNPKKDTHIQLHNEDFGDDRKMQSSLDDFYNKNK